MASFCLLVGDGSKLVKGGYDSFRSEGRFPINIGYGLAKMGHKVDIFSYYSLIVNDNLKFINHADIIYDYAFAFSCWDRLYQIKAKKYFLMINGDEVKELDNWNINNGKIIFCSSYYSFFNKWNSTFKLKNPYIYFPVPFPIPDIYESFLPYKFNIIDNTINVCLLINTCGTNYNEWIFKMYDDIFKYLSNYKINLTIITGTVFKEAAINYFTDKVQNLSIELAPITYNEIYKKIENCTFGMVFGNCAGSGDGQYDYVSLGRNMMFFICGKAKDFYIVQTMDIKGNVFFHNQGNYNKKDLENYINDFFINHYRYYNNFKIVLRDSEFDNWKNYINKMLIDIEYL